jgi:hypothetical protein
MYDKKKGTFENNYEGKYGNCNMNVLTCSLIQIM